MQLKTPLGRLSLYSLSEAKHERTQNVKPVIASSHYHSSLWNCGRKHTYRVIPICIAWISSLCLRSFIFWKAVLRSGTVPVRFVVWPLSVSRQVSLSMRWVWICSALLQLPRLMHNRAYLIRDMEILPHPSITTFSLSIVSKDSNSTWTWSELVCVPHHGSSWTIIAWCSLSSPLPWWSLFSCHSSVLPASPRTNFSKPQKKQGSNRTKLEGSFAFFSCWCVLASAVLMWLAPSPKPS